MQLVTYSTLMETSGGEDSIQNIVVRYRGRHMDDRLQRGKINNLQLKRVDGVFL